MLLFVFLLPLLSLPRVLNINFTNLERSSSSLGSYRIVPFKCPKTKIYNQTTNPFDACTVARCFRRSHFVHTPLEMHNSFTIIAATRSIEDPVHQPFFSACKIKKKKQTFSFIVKYLFENSLLS